VDEVKEMTFKGIRGDLIFEGKKSVSEKKIGTFSEKVLKVNEKKRKLKALHLMFLKKTSTTEQEIDAMNANFVRIIKYELK
jgi:hypothetical protein